MFNLWEFQDMGFLIHGPGRTAKLYFSVPVDLYTICSAPVEMQNCISCPPPPAAFHAKNPGQNPGLADHVL